MHEKRELIEIHICGYDVFFYYLPEEPQVLTGRPDDWCPGFPEEIEIVSVKRDNQEMVDTMQAQKLNRLAQDILLLRDENNNDI